MKSEFRTGWPVVLSAAFGAGLGISGLLTYNSGLFQPFLETQIGLTRSGFSAAIFASTVATAVAVPIVGKLVDRHGARLIAVCGAIGLAIGFAALAWLAATPALYVAIMIATGLIGSGCTPVPFTRAVSARFDRSRGLALGMTQVGIGLSAALVPPLIGRVIADHGWRAGFLALAGLAAIGIVPVLIGLPGLAAAPRSRAAPVSLRATRRTALFRLQVAACATMAFAFAGMLSHFVPMLHGAGMPIAQAGSLAGLIGVSVIGSRILIGWLADRIEPAWLGSASCLLCGAGCLILASGGANAAPIGAIALGSAMGAEADLIAILTARHFALPVYGRAYALQYCVFMLAAGVSPLWIGYLADLTGNYRLALVSCAGLLLIPTLLFGLLPAVASRTPAA